jgi:copper chaperone NosL
MHWQLPQICCGSCKEAHMRKGKCFILFGISMCFIFLAGVAFAQHDAKKYPSCQHCGMNREAFAYSRMLIEYTDGTIVGTCSIRCAAVDLALNSDKTLKAIMVGDYNSKALIDARKAIWVMGGKKTGVMTEKAKWAFAQKSDAERFIAENGGKITSYDAAMKAAYKDLDVDTKKMIREKKKSGKMEHK